MIKIQPVSQKSLRSIAQGLKIEIEGGLPSGDSVIPVRLIEARLKEKVAMLQRMEDLENELRGIPPNINRAIPFPCLPLKDTNDFACKCTKYGGSLKKVELPKFLEWNGRSYITYFGSTSMDLEYVPSYSITHLNSLEGVINKPKYFLSGTNGYVSLPSEYSLVCEVTVIGIPEDPTTTSGPCFDPWSEEWNVSAHIKAMAIDQVRATFLPGIAQAEQSRDIRNNAQSGNEFVTINTP